MPWIVMELVVEVDLALEKGKDKPTEYHEVKLLFVRSENNDEGVGGSRKNRALFLNTDPGIAVSTMLETYALRWSIEAYFKLQDKKRLHKQAQTLCRREQV